MSIHQPRLRFWGPHGPNICPGWTMTKSGNRLGWGIEVKIPWPCGPGGIGRGTFRFPWELVIPSKPQTRRCPKRRQALKMKLHLLIEITSPNTANQQRQPPIAECLWNSWFPDNIVGRRPPGVTIIPSQPFNYQGWELLFGPCWPCCVLGMPSSSQFQMVWCHVLWNPNKFLMSKDWLSQKQDEMLMLHYELMEEPLSTTHVWGKNVT